MSSTGQLKRVLRRIAPFAPLLLLALFLARGTDAPFTWGHEGWTSSAFQNAAVVTARHGEIAQAQAWTENVPPPTNVLYLRHPQLMHWGILLSHHLFGTHRWATRLPFALATFLLGLFLIAIVREHVGEWTGGITGLAFGMNLMFILFGGLVDHEAGGSLYCVVALCAWWSWRKSPSGWRLTVLLLSISGAVQWDWTGYELALVIWLMMLFDRSIESRRLRFISSSVFAVVVLVNFVGYFGWAYSVFGSFDDLIMSYTSRSHMPLTKLDFVRLQGERIWDLLGPLLSLVLVAYLLRVVWSLFTRRWYSLDAFTLPLLFVCIVHNVAFPGSAVVHVFWLYYLLPTACFALAALVQSLPPRVERAQVVLGIVVLLAMGATGPTLLERTRAAIAQGHLGAAQPVPLLLPEMALASYIRDAIPGRPVVYTSLPPLPQVHASLDSPIRFVSHPPNGVPPSALLIFNPAHLSRTDQSVLQRHADVYESWTTPNGVVAIWTEAPSPSSHQLEWRRPSNWFEYWWTCGLIADACVLQ